MYTQLGVITKGTVIEVNVSVRKNWADDGSSDFSPPLTTPFPLTGTWSRHRRRQGRVGQICTSY